MDAARVFVVKAPGTYIADVYGSKKQPQKNKHHNTTHLVRSTDMKKKHGLQSLRMAPRAAGFALATVLPLAVSTASAFELNLGAVTGSLDTTLSYGTGWRMEAQDENKAALYPDYASIVKANRRTFINKNDGDANFDNDSKPISSVYKITSDLELKWNDFGVFVRGTAFYDTVLSDEYPNRSQPAYFPNSVSCNTQSTVDVTACGFPSELDNKVASDVRALDAYVYGNFDVGGRALNVRLGEQVINWGEALFLQDGINNANPVSLSQLRLPGAEIKEALLPLPMIFASYELADSLTMEAFYEFDWDYSEADGVGTFYSTDDAFAGDGANRILVDFSNSAFAGLVSGYNPNGSTSLTADRISDKPVDSAGQFGVSFRYSMDETEFGLFYMNYHSHKPVAQATTAGFTTVPGNLPANINSALAYIDNTVYQIVYPEDIQMIGLTFSTTVGDLALSGELAYRPNDVILSELGDNLVAYNSIAAICYGLSQCDPTEGISFGETLNNGNPIKPGDTVKVWEELETYNLDFVAINNFGPALGANGVIGVLEVGANYVPKGEDKRYASTASLLNIPTLTGDSAAASGFVCPAPGSTTAAIYEADTCLSEGPSDDYMDNFSWGYRMVLSATYNDVFAGVTLNPVVRFAHDVDGNSHRTGNFHENRKSATVGMNAVYNNEFDVGVAYNSFWGAESSNLLSDRDNLTLTLKYSF